MRDVYDEIENDLMYTNIQEASVLLYPYNEGLYCVVQVLTNFLVKPAITFHQV